MPDASAKPLIDYTDHPDWVPALQLFQTLNQFISQMQRQLGLRVPAEDMLKVAALIVALAESGHHKTADFPALLEIAKRLTADVGRHVAMNPRCACGDPKCQHVRPAV